MQGLEEELIALLHNSTEASASTTKPLYFYSLYVERLNAYLLNRMTVRAENTSTMERVVNTPNADTITNNKVNDLKLQLRIAEGRFNDKKQQKYLSLLRKLLLAVEYKDVESGERAYDGILQLKCATKDLKVKYLEAEIHSTNPIDYYPRDEHLLYCYIREDLLNYEIRVLKSILN